jgi:hypothetical protein
MVRDGASAPPHHEAQTTLRPLSTSLYTLELFLLRGETLILRSGVFAASRRMKATGEASWFETAQGASSP